MSEKETRKKIALLHPIQTEEGGVKATITHVTLGRMKGKHLRSLPAGLLEGKVEPKDMLEILKAMCGLTDQMVDELDFEDITMLMNEVNSFFAPSQESQTSSSGQ